MAFYLIKFEDLSLSGFLSLQPNIPLDELELAVPEHMRPRVSRRLGIPLEWDVAIDALPTPSLTNLGGMLALACRLYRRIRPKIIGDRCAYEPSCSRYAELCFREFGWRKGAKLTWHRLRRCKACNGGLDLPPEFKVEACELEERIS